MSNVLHLIYVLIKTRNIITPQNFLMYSKNKSLKRSKKPFPYLTLQSRIYDDVDMIEKNNYDWEKKTP